MTSRPYLARDWEVRALLAGTKTQARVPVRWPKWADAERDWPALVESRALARYVDGRPVSIMQAPAFPGDLLYVRETWRISGFADWWNFTQVTYRADGEIATIQHGKSGVVSGESEHWRPSIHMPKWAARIWLRVTGVRVERVQDISEADARAEGAARANGHPIRGAVWGRGPCYCEGFAQTWLDCYGRESWDANPWVWAISFERTEAPAREGGR